MSDLKTIYNDISSANLEYRAAVGRNTGIAAAKDRVKNLMFNHRDEIMKVLYDSSKPQAELERLREQLAAMESELAVVDDENNELKKEVRKLKDEISTFQAQATKKSTKRKTGAQKLLTAVVE